MSCGWQLPTASVGEEDRRFPFQVVDERFQFDEHAGRFVHHARIVDVAFAVGASANIQSRLAAGTRVVVGFAQSGLMRFQTEFLLAKGRMQAFDDCERARFDNLNDLNCWLIAQFSGVFEHVDSLLVMRVLCLNSRRFRCGESKLFTQPRQLARRERRNSEFLAARPSTISINVQVEQDCVEEPGHSQNRKRHRQRRR